mgnify:FL=1
MSNHKSQEKTFHKGYIAYIAYIIIVILSIIIVNTTGTASSVEHNSNQELERDGFLWDKTPQKINEKWSKDGYRKIINTPGSIISVKDDGVARLNTDNGEELWSYNRKDAKLCDAENTNGQVLAIFDSGKGCSEYIQLNAATGEYLNTAEYATTSHYSEDKKEISIVSQQEDILVMTPHHARLLRDDLVTKSEFGDQDYSVNGDDQEHSDCNISDGVIGTDGYAISAKCDNDPTYSIYYMDKDPEESTAEDMKLTIDTRSPQPVTIPVISKAMINFVVPGTPNSVYVWQLTKDQAEVSHNYVKVNEFGYEYQDLPGIGYVWRIGNTINVRHGSEDLSQSEKMDKALSDPIEVDQKLLVPQLNKLVLWDTNNKKKETIQAEGLNGQVFGFSGDTLISFDNGTIKGYK